MSIYPRASSPITRPVLDAANARAERWRQRCDEARAEVMRLQTIIDNHTGDKP